jgi:hypothetical protein
MNEQEILELNDPKKSYWYCHSNKNTANIKAHEQIILNSKNTRYVCWFAESIPGADINLLQSVIINSRNVYYCFRFALHVKDSNKQLLSEIVLALGDLEYIRNFYNNIDFDKSKYETLMLFL